jgi:hypothetical protein
MLDAHGGVITTVQNPTIQSQSRDTTVVRVAPGSMTIAAVGNGTTSVLFTYGSTTDSLRVTVRQVVTSLAVSPAACWSTQGPMPMALGDTLRLKLGPQAYDLAGNAITNSTIVQSAVAQAVWESHPDIGGVPIGVTSDGLVTATIRGRALLRAVLVGSNAPQNYVASCSIDVN